MTGGAGHRDDRQERRSRGCASRRQRRHHYRTTQHWGARVSELTAGRGADLVLGWGAGVTPKSIAAIRYADTSRRRHARRQGKIDRRRYSQSGLPCVESGREPRHGRGDGASDAVAKLEPMIAECSIYAKHAPRMSISRAVAISGNGDPGVVGGSGVSPSIHGSVLGTARLTAILRLVMNEQPSHQHVAPRAWEHSR